MPNYESCAIKKVWFNREGKGVYKWFRQFDEVYNRERDVYSLTLRNNSKFHDDVNLLLGDKETAVKNLKDFSETFKTAKSGEHFDFEVMGLTYTFFYGSTLGQKCFKIWAPNSVSSDYGRLFKATIDDIIKYFLNNGE